MAVHNEEQVLTMGPVPTADVAAGTTRTWTYVCPGPSGSKWEVVEVKHLPDSAVTANGTNFATYTLANATKSQTIATRSYAATNSVANTPETLTVTAASRFVDAGDVLTLALGTAGTGVATACRHNVRLRRVS